MFVEGRKSVATGVRWFQGSAKSPKCHAGLHLRYFCMHAARMASPCTYVGGILVGFCVELLGIVRGCSKDCVCVRLLAPGLPKVLLVISVMLVSCEQQATLIGFVVIRQLPIFSGHPTPHSLTKFQSASRTTAISCYDLLYFYYEFSFIHPLLHLIALLLPPHNLSSPQIPYRGLGRALASSYKVIHCGLSRTLPPKEHQGAESDNLLPLFSILHLAQSRLYGDLHNQVHILETVSLPEKGRLCLVSQHLPSHHPLQENPSLGSFIVSIAMPDRC